MSNSELRLEEVKGHLRIAGKKFDHHYDLGKAGKDGTYLRQDKLVLRIPPGAVNRLLTLAK